MDDFFVVSDTDNKKNQLWPVFSLDIPKKEN
jgi:hypothetical protein